MNTINQKIFIIGHNGFIGKSIYRKLSKLNYELITATREELDLNDFHKVTLFFEKHRPNFVVLAAGKVGGILLNKNYPSDLINENLSIQLNVLRAAHYSRVEKLIFFASSCVYPKECSVAMDESYFLASKPELSSLSYAIAKIAGIQMCLAFNQQYNKIKFIPIIPNSGYGPNDNFNPETAHVISSLISRFHNAKLSNSESIELWGTGRPMREFIHVDDISDACIFLLTHDSSSLELPLNVGSGQEISIKDLAAKISKIVGYKGNILWDKSKPDGAPRKLLDSSRINSYGWSAKINLDQGLKETYDWYVSSGSIF